MIKLGYCKHCSGTLAVKSGLLRDGPLTEERDADGNRLRAIHRDATGQPVRDCQVFCLQCGSPVPEHPYKQQMDDAQQKATETRAATTAARAAAPTVYTQASQSEMVANQFARMEERIRNLEANQEMLLNELAGTKKGRR